MLRLLALLILLLAVSIAVENSNDVQTSLAATQRTQIKVSAPVLVKAPGKQM